MEIKQYLSIVKHWLWLLVLGIILGSVAAFVFSITQDKVYQSVARVQVMSAPGSTQSGNTFYTDTQLANTYVQTLKTSSILEEVGNQLGVSVSPKQVTTRIIGDTQLIDILVEETNPQMAADIANRIVEVFIAKNNELQAGRFLESEKSLQGQIETIDQQIVSLQQQSTTLETTQVKESTAKAQEEIQRLQEDMIILQAEIDPLVNLPPRKTLTPEERILLNDKQLRMEQMQKTYELYQEIYANLVVLGNAPQSSADAQETSQVQSTLALYEQIRANLLGSYEDVRLSRLNSTSNIVQIEQAKPDAKPIRPQTARNTGMGAALGLLLAAGIVFVIEYLDDTLKTADQITEVLGFPVLGYIAEMLEDKDKLYVKEHPRSPVSESFRILRTNIGFAGVDSPIHSLLVVSPNPSEGKSTVASNLAITYAMSGKRVLLIDADMRRPRIHKILGFSNRYGLSDMFINGITLEKLGQKWEDTTLTVVTSGSIPPNPSDLLSSHTMASALEEAQKKFDLVIVDSPPFLVSDPSVLAAKMDGVLVLVYPGKTPIDSAVATISQLQRAGARILGIAMNRIPRNRAYYYGSHRYNYQYYQSDGGYEYLYDEQKPRKKSRFRKQGISEKNAGTEVDINDRANPGESTGT